MNQLQKFVKGLDSFQQKHRLTGFTYAVVKKYGEDEAGSKAALLTSYSFLSLFPLLMILITITNAAITNPQLQAKVTHAVTDYFPLLGQQLSSHVHGLHGGGLALLLGILVAFYGTRGVADVFRRSVQDMWGIDEKERTAFPKSLVQSFGLIVIGGLGFLLASVSSTLASTGGRGWDFTALSMLVNLFVLFWLFTFLLNFSLPRHVTLKQTQAGALSAAIGLVILQTVGTRLLRHELKNLDALYSYFAVALGLLFWIYLQAQMLYYSVEIAVVSSRKLWPRSFSD